MSRYMSEGIPEHVWTRVLVRMPLTYVFQRMSNDVYRHCCRRSSAASASTKLPSAPTRRYVHRVHIWLVFGAQYSRFKYTRQLRPHRGQMPAQMSVRISIHMSTHMSTHMSKHMPVRISMHMSTHMSTHMSIHMSKRRLHIHTPCIMP